MLIVRSNNPMCYDCPTCLAARGQPCPGGKFCRKRVVYAKRVYDADMVAGRKVR